MCSDWHYYNFGGTQASNEERQGRKIGCIEEAAYRMGYIDDDDLLKIADPLSKSGYGDYLKNILKK